jgi:hypothetical protein
MAGHVGLCGNTVEVINKGVKDPNMWHKCDTCQSRYVVSLYDQTCADCGFKYQKQEPTPEEKEFEEFLEYCTERVPCINHCYGISISQYTVDTQNGMCDDCFSKK